MELNFSKRIRINLPDLSYYIAVAYFLIYEMFSTTMIDFGVRWFYFAVMGMLLAGRVIFVKYTNRQLFLASTILIVGIISWRLTGQSYPMKLAAVIASGINIKFETLLRIYMSIVGGILILSLILSLTGVIQNLTYMRIRDGHMYVRQSFGSIYPTNFASHLLYLYLFLAYLRREVFGIGMLSLGWGASVFVYIYNDARFNAVLLAIAATLFYMASKQWLPRRLIRVSVISFPVMGFVSIILAKVYNPSNTFFLMFNKFLSNRLYLMHKMFEDNPLRIFGQKVKLFGFGRTTELPEIYNYIDNSYFQIALLYGVAFLICILVLFTLLHYQAIKYKNVFLVVILVIVSLSSFVEENLISISYNILCISFFANFRFRKFVSQRSQVED